MVCQKPAKRDVCID